MVLVFDCETIDHRLTFGAVEVYEHRQLKSRAVFYRDDLPESDPEGYERLKEICRAVDVRLVNREWFFQNAIWPARKYGWMVAGFNIAYDLSRIADSVEPATKTARLGARFCNGFAFKKGLVGTKKDVPPPVFCRGVDAFGNHPQGLRVTKSIFRNPAPGSRIVGNVKRAVAVDTIT